MIGTSTNKTTLHPAQRSQTRIDLLCTFDFKYTLFMRRSLPPKHPYNSDLVVYYSSPDIPTCHNPDKDSYRTPSLLYLYIRGYRT